MTISVRYFPAGHLCLDQQSKAGFKPSALVFSKFTFGQGTATQFSLILSYYLCLVAKSTFYLQQVTANLEFLSSRGLGAEL